jgi:ABC-type glycerol-3-phosphate transport system substrate-binding protein
VLPLPIINGREDQRLNIFSRGFAVSAATQQPQAAWQLLEYLSRQPDLAENAMPARASVRQATGFWEGVDTEIVEVVEAYLARSFELTHAPTRQALARAVAAALLEGIAVSEALIREEAALRQGLVSEVEPLAAIADHTDASPSVGQILFITDGDNYYRHRALAQAFEQENPGLRIEVQPPQWTTFSGTAFRSMDRASGGRQSDCFTYGPVQTEAEAVRVLHLDALLELEPELSRDDFYPPALVAFLYDGALLGLPSQFSLPLIGYDTTLFDAAGVPYPEIGWTLEEFLETAMALTMSGDQQQQYGYVPHVGDMIDSWLFLHAFDVDLLDRSVEPMAASLDMSSVADALRWYVALSESHGVKPVYLTNLYDLAGFSRGAELLAARRAIFAARQGAMWWDDGSEWEGPYATPTAAIEERRYTTFPVTPNAEANLPMEVTGLYISAKTEQRQACWQWLTFLLEHDPGVGVPARRSVAYGEEFRLRAGPAAEMMLQNAEQMSQRQLVQSPEWMNLRSWYSIALTRSLEEDMSAEEALAVTQTEFETYRHCVVERQLFAPTDKRERLLECAVPASSYVTLREE